MQQNLGNLTTDGDTMDNDIIVGLCGHIDHGKTSLIRAINGFDGDGLREEKERGITLDLSFSHLRTPARNIAFIDVPGHEKLVRQMIAGAYGIDVLLLVVASDDGIMPQTREHLAIADMLGISQCVCVLSKIDKTTPELIDKRKAEIAELFSAHTIALVEIVPFALLDSQGTEFLHNPYVEQLIALLQSLPKPARRDYGMVVYYIDRAFSIAGAGCVVSGTLTSGTIAKSQELLVCETQKQVQVRNIQIHDEPTPRATPSHRVALNLAHTSPHELQRGFLLTQKGFVRGANLIDVQVRCFEGVEIAHNASYELCIGARHLPVRLNVLDEELGLCSLSAREPIFALFMQPFILREGNVSVCGGVVLNPINDPIKKKSKIPLLKALLRGDFAQAFATLTHIHRHGFGVVSSTQRFGLSHQESSAILHTLHESGAVFFDPRDLVAYPLNELEWLKNAILDIFYKNKHALLSAQSLQLKYKWASLGLLQCALDELVAQRFILQRDSLFLAKNNDMGDIEEFLEQKIYGLLCEQGYAPIAPYNLYDSLEIDRKLGDRILKRLTKAQKVLRVAHNLFISVDSMSAIVTMMREIIHTHGYIDIALFRQKLPLSRKYLINYLEYLDRFGDIVKEGDRRVMRF
ncbi:selenocysteine-specific translation elongation factor [uncultured Helicobacter sp.]|uniref:selenocysteine-specific translation elongation factor n=1 Tax=uncultured Helicobacter sp. TaxID=175537 RepID=UPI003753C4D0